MLPIVSKDDFTAQQKATRLHTLIRRMGSVAVAFSAGVDSTYLLAVCCDVLGQANVLAVTAQSPTLPGQEFQAAEALVRHLGVRWEVVQTNELEHDQFSRNDVNRCFYCKQILFHAIQPIAQTYGMSALVYGANADDMHDVRPGMRAAFLEGVRAPLLEVGLRKAEIRLLSEQRGLPTYDKPAMACLASRIPYGSPVTLEVLNQIEEAEAFLKREIGLKQVRVRHHGPIARLEVLPEDMPRLIQADVRERVLVRLRNLGFHYMALDLAGFRSGSLNGVLAVDPSSQ